MTIGVLGGMLALIPVPASAAAAPMVFLSDKPSLPKARLAGSEITRLSPTHMPLMDASHPAGRAVPPNPAPWAALEPELYGARTKYMFSSEGLDPGSGAEKGIEVQTYWCTGENETNVCTYCRTSDVGRV